DSLPARGRTTSGAAGLCRPCRGVVPRRADRSDSQHSTAWLVGVSGWVSPRAFGTVAFSWPGLCAGRCAPGHHKIFPVGWKGPFQGPFVHLLGLVACIFIESRWPAETTVCFSSFDGGDRKNKGRKAFSRKFH